MVLGAVEFAAGCPIAPACDADAKAQAQSEVIILFICPLRRTPRGLQWVIRRCSYGIVRLTALWLVGSSSTNCELVMKTERSVSDRHRKLMGVRVASPNRKTLLSLC